MKLRDKPFERAVRSRIRAERSRDRNVRKDYRHIRKIERSNLHLKPWMGRLFFLGFAAFMAGMQHGAIEWLVAIIVLWHLATVFFRASLLQVALYVSPALGVLYGLPISDSDIFRAQWRKFLRTSLWSLVDFSILFSFLAGRAGMGWFHSMLAGFELGLIEWIFIVAISTGLLSLGWRKYIQHFATFFSVSTFGLFFLVHQQVVIDWICHLASWIPPIGWIIYAMGIARSGGPAFDLLPCLLSAIVLALFPLAYRTLRRRYALNEESIRLAARANATGRPAEFPEATQQFAQPATDVASAIRSGALEVQLDWQRLGLVERIISRFLTARERLIVDFLVAGNPQWTAGFRGFVKLTLAVLAGCWFFTSQFRAMLQSFLLFGGMFLLATFAGQWRGFGFPGGGGAQSPFYALYPIEFRELIRAVLKVNLVRFLFLGPVLLVAGWLVLGRLQLAPESVLLSSLKFFLVGIIAQPWLAIAQISPGTNDGKRSQVVWAALFFILVMLASVITFLVTQTMRVMLVSAVIAAAASVSSLLLYGRFFNNNRFDLVPAQASPGARWSHCIVSQIGGAIFYSRKQTKQSFGLCSLCFLLFR